MAWRQGDAGAGGAARGMSWRSGWLAARARMKSLKRQRNATRQPPK